MDFCSFDYNLWPHTIQTMASSPHIKLSGTILDELVDKIEYAYNHREEIRKIGQKAGEDLKRFTWERTAKRLLGILGIPEAHGS